MCAKWTNEGRKRYRRLVTIWESIHEPVRGFCFVFFWFYFIFNNSTARMFAFSSLEIIASFLNVPPKEIVPYKNRTFFCRRDYYKQTWRGKLITKEGTLTEGAQVLERQSCSPWAKKTWIRGPQRSRNKTLLYFSRLILLANFLVLLLMLPGPECLCCSCLYISDLFSQISCPNCNGFLLFF